MNFNVFGKTCKATKTNLKNMETAKFHGETFSMEYCEKIKDDDLIHALLHELIHATCCRLGMENTSLSDDVEEILADNIPEVFLENFDIKVKTKCKKKNAR